MMSLLGAGLVLAAAVGAAQNLRQALYRRGRELDCWLLAVRLLAREMAYGVVPLPRLCEKLGEQLGNNEIGRFWVGLAEELRQGRALAEVWRELPGRWGAAWHLAAEDWAVLAELGAGLGQSDMAGQKKLLAECEERLQVQLAKSRERYDRLARLISGLGWCGGLLLVCLWL